MNRTWNTAVCLIGVVLATACGGAQETAPTPPAGTTEPAAPPAAPVAGGEPSADDVRASCGVTETAVGKIDPMLDHKLREGATWFNVEVSFTSKLSEAEADALGLTHVEPGDVAIGNVESLGALARLCGDPRVSRIKLSPEMKPTVPAKGG